MSLHMMKLNNSLCRSNNPLATFLYIANVVWSCNIDVKKLVKLNYLQLWIIDTNEENVQALHKGGGLGCRGNCLVEDGIEVLQWEHVHRINFLQRRHHEEQNATTYCYWSVSVELKNMKLKDRGYRCLDYWYKVKHFLTLFDIDLNSSIYKLFTNDWNAGVGFFGFNEPLADDPRRHFRVVESVDEFLVVQNVAFHVEQKLQYLVLDVLQLSFVRVYTENCWYFSVCFSKFYFSINSR